MAKKSALNESQPKVFEIDGDESVLLGFDSVRLNDSPLFACLSILGVGSIAFYFWADSPVKIRRALGIKDNE